MKFVWTRKTNACAETRDTDEEDRAGALRRFSRRPPPGLEPPAVPFNQATCTLMQPPSTSETDAFTRFRATCSGPPDVWDRAPVASWMLNALRRTWHWVPIVPERELRTFAWRSVEALDGTDAPGLRELRRAVHGRLRRRTSLQDLQSLQEATRADAIRNGTDGLRRCEPAAAGALALWHAATPFVYDAAFWAAEFAALHDAYVRVRERASSWAWAHDTDPVTAALKPPFFAAAHPDVVSSALAEARKRQALLLRGLLPAPFAAPPVPARVWRNHQSVFCGRCGPWLEDGVIDEIDDVRFRACARCDTPLIERH
jgi:hypothetical protein